MKQNLQTNIDVITPITMLQPSKHTDFDGNDGNYNLLVNEVSTVGVENNSDVDEDLVKSSDIDEVVFDEGDGLNLDSDSPEAIATYNLYLASGKLRVIGRQRYFKMPSLGIRYGVAASSALPSGYLANHLTVRPDNDTTVWQAVFNKALQNALEDADSTYGKPLAMTAITADEALDVVFQYEAALKRLYCPLMSMSNVLSVVKYYGDKGVGILNDLSGYYNIDVQSLLSELLNLISDFPVFDSPTYDYVNKRMRVHAAESRSIGPVALDYVMLEPDEVNFRKVGKGDYTIDFTPLNDLKGGVKVMSDSIWSDSDAMIKFLNDAILFAEGLKKCYKPIKRFIKAMQKAHVNMNIVRFGEVMPWNNDDSSIKVYDIEYDYISKQFINGVPRLYSLEDNAGLQHDYIACERCVIPSDVNITNVLCDNKHMLCLFDAYKPASARSSREVTSYGFWNIVAVEDGVVKAFDRLLGVYYVDYQGDNICFGTGDAWRIMTRSEASENIENLSKGSSITNGTLVSFMQKTAEFDRTNALSSVVRSLIHMITNTFDYHYFVLKVKKVSGNQDVDELIINTVANEYNLPIENAYAFRCLRGSKKYYSDVLGNGKFDSSLAKIARDNAGDPQPVRGDK